MQCLRLNNTQIKGLLMGNFIKKYCMEDITEVTIIQISPELGRVDEKAKPEEVVNQEAPKNALDKNIHNTEHQPTQSLISSNIKERDEKNIDEDEKLCIMPVQKGKLNYYSFEKSRSMNEYHLRLSIFSNSAKSLPFERSLLKTISTENDAIKEIQKGNVCRAQYLLRIQLGWKEDDVKDWIRRSQYQCTQSFENFSNKP